MFFFQLIIFIGFIILLAVLGFVFRVLSIFGGRRPAAPFGSAGSREDDRPSEPEEPSARRRKKVFDRTDGEYVDFEEIKDKK